MTARTASAAGSRCHLTGAEREQPGWFYIRATMIHDNAPNRVFKISELTKLIASQLVPLSRASTTNLACVCRYLEEPVLSTLWETQLLLKPLLEVLPEGTWDRGRSMRVVCCTDLSLEESNTKVCGCRSPGWWWIRRQRLGIGSGVMHLGCVGSGLMSHLLMTIPTTNCASIRQAVDGFQRYKSWLWA